MRQGYIYLITNKINNLQYVGQTSRDIDTRFNEHCFDSRSTSQIHRAIVEYGWQNFKIEEIEKVPLECLDEREQYWIKYYNTYENGYNSNRGGQPNCRKNYLQILIVENNLIADSKTELARIISEITSWSSKFVINKITESLNNNELFLDYHLKEIASQEISAIDDIENWVKTLNIRYSGKHIYCKELNQHFNTIADAARYMCDNNLYLGNSIYPLQSLVTSIGKNIHNKIEYVSSAQGNLIFEEIPGEYTKKDVVQNNIFKGMKIYCLELDLFFNLNDEAA